MILAANGIGTPRLLLNSASSRFPDGLANSSGLVGKNLMLHPWPQIYGYVDEEMDGDRGPNTVMWSKEFYETDRSRGFVRGYTLQFARGTGPANEAIISMAAGRLPWGKDHHRVYRKLLYRALRIGVACEDLPEEHNRVTLDPVLKDSHGIPAPRIDYTISENTRRMMEHGIARATEILEAAGATQIHPPAAKRAEQPRAPAGNGTHGHRPGAFGRERMGPLSRCEEPVHRRRQHLGHCPAA